MTRTQRSIHRLIWIILPILLAAALWATIATREDRAHTDIPQASSLP
ncbi:MAG: hypothetical protein AB7Q00_07235 [Phycisphaerales bacterium]